MPLMEDREKILENMNKKIDGISKTVESLLSVSKKTSEHVAKQEELESELKIKTDEEKKYKIKTTKLLEEIRDKEINVSGGSGLGSMIGGLISGLGLVGLVSSLTGLSLAINELINWFKGKESEAANKPGMEATTALTGDIGAAAPGMRVMRNIIQGTPLPEREMSRVAVENTKTAVTGRKTTLSKGVSGPEPKATTVERGTSAVKAVSGATGVAVRTAYGAGRSAALGATVAGISTLFDPNLKDMPFADRLEQAGLALGRGALSAALIDVGVSTTANAFSAAGLPSLARAVPIAGLLYGAGDALYRAYTASDWSRNIAESEMLDQGRMDLENTNKQVEVMGQEALKLSNEGKINEAKVIEERAVKMVENAQKNFFALHNVIKTHEKLNQVVDMDRAWGEGQKYSIDDVNFIIKSFKDLSDVNSSDELYIRLRKKGSNNKLNSIIQNVGGYDNVFALLKQAPEILEDYNTNLWARPKEYFNKYGSDIMSEFEKQKRIEEEKIKRMKRESAGSRSVMYGPKYENEGIIQGTRLGSLIIAGENRTPEAVVSTKPNTVTESIGNNIYNIIKEKASTEVTSTQKESMLLESALTRMIKDYNDAYKIAPLMGERTSDGSPTVVNNFMGGMSSRNFPETNAHFNQQGLTTTNTETTLQKVYMDTYKAALL